VSEARSHELGLFGEERLIGLLAACANDGPAQIAERIEEDVRRFQGQTIADDLAVLVMRVGKQPRRSQAGLGSERFEPLRRPAPA
jgi:serine phosphatase RsbU (regulator of sigma subunit)